MEIYIIYLIGWIITHYLMKYVDVYIDKNIDRNLEQVIGSLILTLFFWYLLLLFCIGYIIQHHVRFNFSFRKIRHFLYNILPKYL